MTHSSQAGLASIRGGIEHVESEWEYTYELRESDTGDVFDRSLGAWATYSDARTFGVLRAVEENRASPDEPPLEACVVRRRKAGPWVAVTS